MKLYPFAAFAALLVPAAPALAHHYHAAWHRPVVRYACACRHRVVRYRHHRYYHRRVYRRAADVEVTYYRPRAYYEPYPVYYEEPYYGPGYYYGGGPRFHHWGHGGFEHREFRGEHGWGGGGHGRGGGHERGGRHR